MATDIHAEHVGSMLRPPWLLAARAEHAAGKISEGDLRAIEDRAVEVLTLLADRGQHRAPSVPDLIIAATAELAGLTVLHCDKDFDLIASVTGQAAEWLIAA